VEGREAAGGGASLRGAEVAARCGAFLPWAGYAPPAQERLGRGARFATTLTRSAPDLRSGRAEPRAPGRIAAIAA